MTGVRATAYLPDSAPTGRPAARTSSVPVMIRRTTTLLAHSPRRDPGVLEWAGGAEPDAGLTTVDRRRNRAIV